jgi:hypothetical protein
MFNVLSEWRSEERVAQRYKRKWQVHLLQFFCMLSTMIMVMPNVEAGPYDPIAATQTKWYVSGFTTTRRDDPETACADVNKTNLGLWCGKFWGASLNFIGVYNGTCYNFRAGYNPTTMYGTYRGWLCPYDYTDTQGKLYSNLYFIPLAIEPTCPANSYPMNNADQNKVGQCRCNYPLVADTAGTSCIVQCPAGQQPDATGLACVAAPPVLPSACPILPLAELTDAASLDFERGVRWRPDLLTADYQKKLKCVQDEIIKAGGTYQNTSAYRPSQYQQHLREIVAKDAELNRPGYMDMHPECMNLRDRINMEMGLPPGHALKHGQAVARIRSRHESGTAFDVTPSNLTDGQIATVYSVCGVTNKAVPKERWHTQ